ncbi:hypothetical protein FRC08_000464 [Ceratobasidium sp. 394]|nr:hypothetical protein FRC08_000464 [Ceratobasidium sp. 394]
MILYLYRCLVVSFILNIGSVCVSDLREAIPTPDPIVPTLSASRVRTLNSALSPNCGPI